MTHPVIGIAAVAVMAVCGTAPANAATMIAIPSVVAVSAQSYLDVIAMLEDTGYRVTGMKSTLLGRLKIRAQNREHMREIVVSRSTGEIKSDRIIKMFAAESSTTKPRAATAAVVGTGTTSGSGGSSGSSGGGISVNAGSGGLGVSVGGSGGVNVSAGSGGVGASVGGLSVGLGN